MHRNNENAIQLKGKPSIRPEMACLSLLWELQEELNVLDIGCLKVAIFNPGLVLGTQPMKQRRSTQQSGKYYKQEKQLSGVQQIFRRYNMGYLLNDYNIQVCDNIIDFSKFIRAHNESDSDER